MDQQEEQANLPPQPPPTERLNAEASVETEDDYQVRKNAYQANIQQSGQVDKKKTKFLRITLKLKNAGNVENLETESEFQKVELLQNLDGTSFADLELSPADFIEDKKIGTQSKLHKFLDNVDKIGNKNKTGFGSTFGFGTTKRGGKMKSKRTRTRSRRLTK